MNNQKAFEAELFAKQHYRKLLTAKSSLSKLCNRESPQLKTATLTSNRTISPLDRYEHQTANNKICLKLKEIYKCPETPFRKYRRSNDRKNKTFNTKGNTNTLREQRRSISKENVDIFERILCAKSIITEDWKARERKLKGYGKIARKKAIQTDECLFDAYQELMKQTRMSTGKRPKSSKSRRPSARSRSSQGKIEEAI